MKFSMFSSSIRPAAWAALATLSYAAFPGIAMAGQDIGTVAAKLQSSFGPVADLIGVVFFIIGIVLGGMGVMKFRQGQQSHGQGGIGEAIALVLVGAVLVALPMALGVGVTSIFGGTGQTLNANGGGLRNIQ